MSYRDILIKQIDSLEKEIREKSGDKKELQSQLDRLRLAEFEEDMSSGGGERQLLQE